MKNDIEEKSWEEIIKGFEDYEIQENKKANKYLLKMFGVCVLCIIIGLIIKSIIPIYSMFLISLLTLGK